MLFIFSLLFTAHCMGLQVRLAYATQCRALQHLQLQGAAEVEGATINLKHIAKTKNLLSTAVNRGDL